MKQKPELKVKEAEADKKAEAEKQKEINKKLNVYQRLFNFQNEDIIIPKSKEAYGYSYAELDSILEIIKPFMVKHGIGYFHDVNQENENSKLVVTTTIFSSDDVSDNISSRTYIDDEVKLSGMNKFMVMGSAITYFRRYHLVTLLGLTTEKDSDAGGARTNTTSKSSSKKAKGRSIESAKQEGGENTVDYVKIFTNLKAKNKSVEQMNKMFNTYKKNMTNDVIKEINNIISDKEDGNK